MSAATQTSPETAPAIEALGLTRRFGDRVAVDRLDLRIPRNATFGLLGANGAGKTTFLRMVTGTLLPSSGELRVEGLSPVASPHAVQRRLGFVMETSRLYPELRVAGFLRFAGGARGLRGAPLRQAVERVMARFGLESVARRLCGQLSKGFQQRVSLAQAFLHDPPLVVVDEPSGGLDPLQREEVWSALAEVGAERSVLLCTHDLDEARALASRVGVLHAGRLVAEGPTAEILGAGQVARSEPQASEDQRDPLALFRPHAVPAP